VEKRERELLRGKQNERETGHMGVWGARAGPGRVAGRAENTQQTRPLIERKMQIETRNETDVRLNTTSGK
jgi:hypothetical protein